MKAARRAIAALLGLGLTVLLAKPGLAMEQVDFPSRDGTPLTGWLAKPTGPGPFPVVVGLHGCAGLWTRTGALSAREADWSARLNAAGYAVLFPDSFRPRGVTSLCNERTRALTPAGRARDAFGARDWLARQASVVSDRISLIGWSNGGETALRVAGDSDAKAFRQIIVFYPGCRATLKQGWSAQAPTTILQGLADNWTPAAPCEELARIGGARFTGFPGAFHDFDHPDLPLRERSAAFSERPDGKVTIGTNVEARQQAIAAVMAILAGP